TGKSHDAYENLPRPLIVVDSDVSAALFNDDRFEGFKRLGPDKVPDLETLVAFLDEFTSDVRWYRSYKSLLIDSLTQFVDPKVAELGIDNSSAAPAANLDELQGAPRSRALAEQGRAQADWARIAKELTRLIRKVERGTRPRAGVQWRRAEECRARRLRSGDDRARRVDGASEIARLGRARRQDPAREDAGVPRRGA